MQCVSRSTTLEQYGISPEETIESFALKGSVHNFYGGISMKLAPVKANKITILNSILRQVGYVTLEAKEDNTLRMVMNMLKDKNGKLVQRVRRSGSESSIS